MDKHSKDAASFVGALIGTFASVGYTATHITGEVGIALFVLAICVNLLYRID